MKLLALTVGLGLLSGCPADAEHADLTATWKIQKVDGTEVGCNPAFPTIKVHVHTYTSRLGAQEQERYEYFDCSAGSGTLSLPVSGDIPGDDISGFDAQDVTSRYDVWISQINEADPYDPRQTSIPNFYVDIANGATVENILYEDAGYLATRWSFEGMALSSDYSCATGGVDTIELHATNLATNMTTVDKFPCQNIYGHLGYSLAGQVSSGDGDGEGQSRVLPAGDYKLIAKAFAGATEIGASDPNPFTERVLPLTGHERGAWPSTLIRLTNRP
jgi:hypothetical protein